ncbi:DUF447 family protein [Thermococcus sp. Bubb.Bath]|nr:DUF447 domain-containing protein [Thermococcus sp. Bubb.Bath]NJF24389.1 DUF447 family protein [Thermococcus sp. Bubb.Bath]
MLLVTRTNVTPVGVVKREKALSFKLFGGRSAEELVKWPHAALQATNDVGLIVRLALNIPLDSELPFEESGPYRWIKGLPGVYGDVGCTRKAHSDSLGTTEILSCSLFPKADIPGLLPPRPFSRADCALVEMAIDFTRLGIAVNSPPDEAKRLFSKIKKNYALFSRLGGKDKMGRKIMERALEIASKLGLTEELE